MMEILKFALIGLAALLVLVLIIPIFTKKEIAAVRDVVINRPKSEVFEYVRLLKNQDYFSVWAGKDPDMKKDYRGEDGKIGFVSAWESKMKPS